MSYAIPFYKKYTDKINETLFACITDHKTAFVVRICSRSGDTDLYIYHNVHFVDLLLNSEDSKAISKAEFWTEHEKVMSKFSDIFYNQFPDMKKG